MALILTTSDFDTGQVKLPMDKFTKPDIQFYIDKYEKQILLNLLGCDLYADFETDWNLSPGNPTALKFQEIYKPFCKDDSFCKQHISLGIKEMLKLFVYFYYLRDLPVKNNIGGIKKNEQANSTEANFFETNIFTNYNEAISTFWAIQWIICDNPNNYDWGKYNGIHLEKISMV